MSSIHLPQRSTIVRPALRPTSYAMTAPTSEPSVPAMITPTSVNFAVPVIAVVQSAPAKP